MTPAEFRAALVDMYGASAREFYGEQAALAIYWQCAADDLALSPQTIRAMWYGRRKVTARTEKQLANLMEK